MGLQGLLPPQTEGRALVAEIGLGWPCRPCVLCSHHKSFEQLPLALASLIGYQQWVRCQRQGCSESTNKCTQEWLLKSP